MSGILAPIVSGILGGKKAGAADREAQRMIDALAEQYKNLKVPDLASQQYDPAMQDYVGDIDPALLASVPGLESALSEITTDPRFTQAQYQSLGSLDEIIQGGGLSQMDKLNFQRAQDQAAQQAARQQAAITRNMAERGIAGGGAELAQQLAASQGAANRSSEAAQTMAATAQQRALQALMQRGSLAGDMQQQDFGRQSTIAQARDNMNRWNQELAQSTARANQQATNAAAATNQQMRQGVAGANQNATNRGREYNANAVGQQYGQQLDRLQGMSGAVGAQATNRANKANQIRDQYTGYSNAINGALASGTKMLSGTGFGSGSGFSLTPDEPDVMAGENDRLKGVTYA